MRRLLAAVLVFAGSPLCSGQIPPREFSTSRSEVDSALLAYLHGVVLSDAALNATGDELEAGFPEFVPDRPTPFFDIVRLSRTRTRRIGSDGAIVPARVTFEFSVPLVYEVAVDILGHHPVVLLGSRTFSFDEAVRGPSDLPAGVGLPVGVTRAIVFSRSRGYLAVDFAEWLDFISGRLIDDVDVTLIAVVRHDGTWYALMGGVSPQGRVLVGVFDMKSNRFRLRPERELTRFARDLVTHDW